MKTNFTEGRNQSLRNLSQRVLAVIKGCLVIPKYLRLLLSFLILEVLGVLTSSHCLKFRSNTHRKGSLLINNNIFNTQLIYSLDTLIVLSHFYSLF